MACLLGQPIPKEVRLFTPLLDGFQDFICTTYANIIFFLYHISEHLNTVYQPYPSTLDKTTKQVHILTWCVLWHMSRVFSGIAQQRNKCQNHSHPNYICTSSRVGFLPEEINLVKRFFFPVSSTFFFFKRNGRHPEEAWGKNCIIDKSTVISIFGERNYGTWISTRINM